MAGVLGLELMVVYLYGTSQDMSDSQVDNIKANCPDFDITAGLTESDWVGLTVGYSGGCYLGVLLRLSLKKATLNHAPKWLKTLVRATYGVLTYLLYYVVQD